MSEEIDSSPRILRAADLDGVEVSALFEGVTVVRRRVLEDLRAVADELDRARHEADEIRRHAEQASAKIREDAHLAGEADGIRQFLEALREREVERADARREAKDDLLDLAFALATRLVGHELQRDSSAFVDLVSESVRQARTAPRITLRVHPETATALAEHRDQLLAHVGGVPLDIEPDAELTPLDCVVETADGTVDGRFEVRLAALQEALSKGGRDDR